MAVLTWDALGQRFYETGVDHGVLYIPNETGEYDNGVAWNGLVGVTETPSGAEESAQYADNIKYLSLTSAEEFGATLECFTYPDEWAQFDGSVELEPGVVIGQQDRRSFGLSYRTIVGNDLQGNAYGHKYHLVYGAKATPSERAYTTVNDSPEPITFSWEMTTTGVAVPGFKPTSLLTVDTTKATPASVTALLEALHGTAGTDPRLPLPEEIMAMFAGSITEVTAVEPAFVAATGVITIPTVTGVRYRRADTNALVANGSTVTITVPGDTLIITAEPVSGAYDLSDDSDDDWAFTRTP